MTREEAIKRIQQDLDVNKKYLSKEYKEALNMAIESLKVDVARWSSWNKTFEQSGIADLISRADAIEAVRNHISDNDYGDDGDIGIDAGLQMAINELTEIPSADRPSGEWIIRENGNKECSLCGHERQDGWDYFCGYCGAKMGGNK